MGISAVCMIKDLSSGSVVVHFGWWWRLEWLMVLGKPCITFLSKSQGNSLQFHWLTGLPELSAPEVAHCYCLRPHYFFRPCMAVAWPVDLCSISRLLLFSLQCACSGYGTFFHERLSLVKICHNATTSEIVCTVWSHHRQFIILISFSPHGLVFWCWS